MSTILEQTLALVNAQPQQTQVQYDRQAQIQEVGENAIELGIFAEKLVVLEQLRVLEVLANRMGRYDAADSYRNRINHLEFLDGKL